jgi:hypothetical protein
MRIIDAVVKGGKIEFDFTGFAGDDCSTEEAAIQAALARFGVGSEIESEEKQWNWSPTMSETSKPDETKSAACRAIQHVCRAARRQDGS